MMWYAIYAVTVMIMTDAGIKHQHERGHLAHGKPFISKEACHRWLEKTDFVNHMETVLDAMPRHTVIKIGGGCYQPGREI